MCTVYFPHWAWTGSGAVDISLNPLTQALGKASHNPGSTLPSRTNFTHLLVNAILLPNLGFHFLPYPTRNAFSRSSQVRSPPRSLPRTSNPHLSSLLCLFAQWFISLFSHLFWVGHPWHNLAFQQEWVPESPGLQETGWEEGSWTMLHLLCKWALLLSLQKEILHP